MSQGGEPSRADSERELDPLVSTSGDSDEETGTPFDEMLRGAPPELRHQVGMMMAVSGGIQQHPFLSKLDADHIHKIMDYSEAESVREDRQAHSNRKWVFAAFAATLVTGCAVLIFMVLQDQTSLLGQILAGLAIFSGGFGGGFGVGRRGR